MSCDDEEDRDRHGEEGQPGPQGRVALDVLEELGQEVEEAVEAGVEQARGGVGRAAWSRWARSRSGQDRLGGPALVAEEEAEQDRPDDERARR